MAYDVVVGRDEEDKERLKDNGLILLGKTYVRMGRDVSLVNPLFVDVAKPHTILICGKKGSGKSYSIAVMAENIADLPEDIRENLSVVILDTMGIFWTMKYENRIDKKLLKEWGFEGKEFDIDIYTPKGYYQDFKSQGIPTDFEFGLTPNLLSIDDWCDTFNIKISSKEGSLIARVLGKLKLKKYGVEDIMYEVEEDELADHNVKNVVNGMFSAAKNWGLFDVEAKNVSDVIKRGKINVIDLSCYDNWNIKSLVVGLLSKKLLRDRVASRKKEELDKVMGREKESKMPMVWMFIDEAHQFLGKDKKTAATDPLIALLREGRQPGISLVLATQQPGKIHDDVITQSDIVLCHRVTAKQDIDALNSMMQSYMEKGLSDEINNLPREKGSCVILDDTSERIYPIRVRPRLSWHGGVSPSLFKKGKIAVSKLE